MFVNSRTGPLCLKTLPLPHNPDTLIIENYCFVTDGISEYSLLLSARNMSPTQLLLCNAYQHGKGLLNHEENSPPSFGLIKI